MQAKERKDSEPARLERLEVAQAEMSEAVEQLLLKQAELHLLVESLQPTHANANANANANTDANANANADANANANANNSRPSLQHTLSPVGVRARSPAILSPPTGGAPPGGQYAANYGLLSHPHQAGVAGVPVSHGAPLEPPRTHADMPLTAHRSPLTLTLTPTLTLTLPLHRSPLTAHH